MTANCYGAALLLLFPFGSIAQSPSPDSSAVSPRRHLLTVHTLHLASPFVPALGYETRVRSRWGVRVSLGGQHDSYRYNSYYIDANGVLATGTAKESNLSLYTDISLNYYLQARKPALIGWFVGAGFLTAFNHDRYTNGDPAYGSKTYRHIAARPTLRAGRHWALGQRWLLDTNVGVVIWSDPYRGLYVEELIGVGAGYRF